MQSAGSSIPLEIMTEMVSKIKCYEAELSEHLTLNDSDDGILNKTLYNLRTSQSTLVKQGFIKKDSDMWIDIRDY